MTLNYSTYVWNDVNHHKKSVASLRSLKISKTREWNFQNDVKLGCMVEDGAELSWGNWRHVHDKPESLEELCLATGQNTWMPVQLGMKCSIQPAQNVFSGSSELIDEKTKATKSSIFDNLLVRDEINICSGNLTHWPLPTTMNIVEPIDQIMHNWRLQNLLLHHGFSQPL